MKSIPGISAAGAYMARHSRSFRFATLLLGPAERGRIERVYAWCRHTDNLVDAPETPGSMDGIDEALDDWLWDSSAAYDGRTTGMPMLDAVMTDLRRSGGSFSYPQALIRGVRSDLRFRHFETMDDLRGYTYDVASVVGLWLCALHGVRDPWMLDRAAALGHAMQLTNILRDVGEDMQAGRVYLPLDLMQAHGVTMLDLYEMRSGRRPITGAYRALMEDLIARADADYRFAAEAIPLLPREFGRSVAVAAAIYADIHESLRANGYDNFNRRARTTTWRKIVLATRSLCRPRQRSADQELAPLERKPLGAKVIALRDFHAPRVGDAVPGLQLARLRSLERRR